MIREHLCCVLTDFWQNNLVGNGPQELDTITRYRLYGLVEWPMLTIYCICILVLNIGFRTPK